MNTQGPSLTKALCFKPKQTHSSATHAPHQRGTRPLSHWRPQTSPRRQCAAIAVMARLSSSSGRQIAVFRRRSHIHRHAHQHRDYVLNVLAVNHIVAEAVAQGLI